MKIETSPVGTIELSPYEAWIVLNVVFLQECEELLFEGAFAVMFLLVANVCNRGLQLGNADGESAITIRPAKGLPSVS